MFNHLVVWSHMLWPSSVPHMHGSWWPQLLLNAETLLGWVTCSMGRCWWPVSSCQKWMFNWSEFGHAWLKLNWMLRLHSGTMDNALDLSYGLATSGLSISGIQLRQSASIYAYKSGWCILWACYIYKSTGWINNWFHSKISSWFKCQVVCWKLATGVTTVTVVPCHSASWLSPPVTVTRDRWNNETVGQFLVLDLWTPEEWKTDKILLAVNIYQ